MRADHAGFLGYERPTTPFLDCLAEESIVFRNAIVAGAPTYYSVPAILASRFPLSLGRDLLGLAADESTIASVLRESGFATAAFSAANPYITARFGYESGFEVFRNFVDASGSSAVETTADGSVFRTRVNTALANACHAIPGLSRAYDELYFQYCQASTNYGDANLDARRRFPSADQIMDHAIAWLGQNSHQPFFLWLHLMDPHAPYYPKAEALQLMNEPETSPRAAGYLNALWNREDVSTDRLKKKREEIVRLYDAGIRWVDEQIRRLTETLVEMNVWDKCALTVTADHGEEFLEHGGRFHSPVRLAQELIHVPLLIRMPGFSRKQVDSVTSIVDLGPTLLDILDVPIPADFRGRSLWSSLKKNQTWDRPAITECVHGCTNPFYRKNRAGPRILAVTKGGYKLVIDFSTGADELFDLRSDPHEQNPLPGNNDVRARRELLEHAKKHVVESRKARDFDRRQALLLRDLRLEWAHPAAIFAN